MKWEISYPKELAKSLKHLSTTDKNRIKTKIEWLANQDEPNSHGKKLVGKKYDDIFRIRVGNFRILYRTEKNILTIIIIRIGHRSNVYKS